MKPPRRGSVFHAPARRSPASRAADPCAECGHPRSEHRYGSKSCRHTKTTSTRTQDEHGITEHYDIQLCDCLRMK